MIARGTREIIMMRTGNYRLLVVGPILFDAYKLECALKSKFHSWRLENP